MKKFSPRLSFAIIFFGAVAAWSLIILALRSF